MKKKIISTILSAVFLTSFILSCLTGCSAGADQNHYTVLEWLDKVEESFNLLYYTETEPLVKTVKTSDSGFSTVQIAAEWGIINPEDDLKLNSRVTKEFAADTLVRAMNCVTPSSVDISDSKKVKALYLDNVMSSVNEGIFALNNGKFDPKKQLTIPEADVAMLVAYDKWINFSYGESYDKSIVKENVINLGGVTSENSEVVPAEYSVKYTGNKTFFDENGGYTDNVGKTITFPAGQAPAGLTTDSILAMPADDVIPMNYAVVVTGVKTNSDGSVTVTTRNAQLEEVFDELDIQQSEVLDFSEAIFYGPDGQRLEFGKNYEAADMAFEADEVNASSLGLYRPDEQATLPVDDKLSMKFKLGDKFSVTVDGSLAKSSGKLGVKFEGKFEEDDFGELKVELGFEEAIKVENKLKTHWEWFQLKVDELKLSATNTITKTAGATFSSEINFGKINNTIKDHNGNGTADIGDWATEAGKLNKIYKQAQQTGKSFTKLSEMAKNDSNKKLFDVVFPNTNLHFVIRAEITFEGSVKLTVTQSVTAGVELMNGKLRTINEKEDTRKLEYTSKLELALRIGLELQLLGINVADFGVKAGIGGKVSSVVYAFDSSEALLEICGIQGSILTPNPTIDAGQGVEIGELGLEISFDETRTIKVCRELSLYPILSVYACSDASIAGKLFGSAEFTVFDDDTPFAVIHTEEDPNGRGVVKECTISANGSFGIKTGDKLTLNAEEYAVSVNEEGDTGLAVATLPKKATIKDIRITSENPDILEVKNLMTSAEGFTAPKPKLELKITGIGAINKDTTVKDTRTINIGSWFYEDMEGAANPQFVLVGKKDGTVNVTVSVNGESVTIPVKVGLGEEATVSSGALIVTTGTFTLAPGETAQAGFDFIPEGKSMSDISFTSSNSSVATVSGGGQIRAVGNGDAVITAALKGKDKDYTATFTVHVVT